MDGGEEGVGVGVDGWMERRLAMRDGGHRMERLRFDEDEESE